MLENWVSVKVTCARRPKIEALPPPDSNSRDRLTIAMPSLIEIPRSFDRSGMAVNIAGRPAISASLGPWSRAVMAAVATAVVLGTSRRTGTRPSFPVKLPMMK